MDNHPARGGLTARAVIAALHGRKYIVDLAIHGHDYSEMQQSYRPVIVGGRAMTARKDRQP